MSSDMRIRVESYLAKLENPAKIVKYLAKLAYLDIPQDILKTTCAVKTVSKLFDHPMCGKLARRTVQRWHKSATSTTVPSSPEKSAATLDTTPRWTLSPEWAIILATIQFDPLPTVKKEEVSKKVVDVEEPVVKKARYSDDKENSFSQFTSKKERSKMYSGKSSSPPLSTSSSSSSPPPISSTTSTLKRPNDNKAVEEARLKEIAARIEKRKAEAQANNRKTVILGKTDSRALSYRTL
ncbi:hypothetical protein PRIPAC_93723 [Pristionchus pacificus]|uniref:Uncharacterized protein n=1 Tax=Pristionchus pacificus TaxID=54126 RepID=A0A454XW77_PRIPA|nr:hypothetical protein PRIPAC_93723 [Pristionchus pacificus]|eukprot:PDM68176.1 hypothetical protein PRIPAC_46220 [Pristionchus pacificus]